MNAMPENNIDKLKKVIGIDFSHTIGPHPGMAQNAPPIQAVQNAVPQNIVRPAIQPQMQQAAPQIKPQISAQQPYPQPMQRQAMPIQQMPVQQQPIAQNRPMQQMPQSVMPNTYPVRQPQKDQSTPLFVKIDKHAEIRKSTVDVRRDMKNIINTISLLAEAEKLKDDAIAKMESQIQVLRETLNTIDHELIAPDFIKNAENTSSSESQGDDFKTLHTEIQSLKSELSSLK